MFSSTALGNVARDIYEGANFSALRTSFRWNMSFHSISTFTTLPMYFAVTYKLNFFVVFCSMNYRFLVLPLASFFHLLFLLFSAPSATTTLHQICHYHQTYFFLVISDIFQFFCCLILGSISRMFNYFETCIAKFRNL
jgi:hypothetical protein